MDALGADDAELRQMGPQRVDQHRPLPDQQLPCPMHRQNRLLLGRLHRDEPHRRPAHRLANRLGIRRVVLVALDVGLDVLRRHQPDLMAQRRNRPRPVVRRRTRLHADKAPRQSLEEPQNLNAAHRFTDHHGAARIDAMDLKNVLGQINSDRRNLAHGWLPPLVILDDTILALEMPSGGHPPHHFRNAKRSMPRPSTNKSTVPAARWRTGSRKCQLDLLADRTSTAGRQPAAAVVLVVCLRPARGLAPDRSALGHLSRRSKNRAGRGEGPLHVKVRRCRSRTSTDAEVVE